MPLVLHLLQRRRTVQVPFPTIRFLKLAQRRSASRVRFENLLLWLLRTLLLLLLALAFAYPVLREARFGGFFGLGRAPRDVALVLDVSYSMSYEMDRETAWARAREAAVAVVESLRPGDRASLVLAGDPVETRFETPIAETALLIQALRATDWRPESSDLRAGIVAGLKTLVDSGNRDRELYVFTDGQALPWEPFDSGIGSLLDDTGFDADDFVTFVLLSGARNPQNAWVETASISPPLVLEGGDARVAVRVGHTGDPRGLSISLEHGGEEVQRRSLALGGDGDTEMDFSLTDMPAGIHVLTLRTAPDALPIDDRFQVLLRVHSALPILVAGPFEATRFLSLALRPASAGRDVRRIDPDALADEPLRDYDTIFLADALPLSGQALLAVERYVRGGGVLVLFPGNRATPSDYQDWSVLPAVPESVIDVRGRQTTRLLRRTSDDAGLFSGFTLPPGAAPAVSIRRRLVFGEPAPDASSVMIAGADEPFLLSRNVDAGRVFCFAVSADRNWSTFPVTALFLPVLHQIVRFGAAAGQPPPSLTPNRTYPLHRIVPDYQPGDRLLSPDGRLLPVRELRDAQGVHLYLEGLMEPGLYNRIRAGENRSEPVAAVNVDRLESRLTPVDPDRLQGLIGSQPFHLASSAAELQHLIDTQRRGRPLAEPLLWVTLCLALAEWWMANRAQRRRLNLADNLRIEPSGRVRKRPQS